MRFSYLVGLLPVTSSASHNEPAECDPPHEWVPAPTNGTDHLARQGMQKLEAYLQTHSNSNSTCTLETAYRRKEWDTFSRPQKLDYIHAVKCLQSKPGLSGDLAPGVRSRFDDFVATHVNQTLSIHSTGNFLTWHRYFVYTYEKALREECGYQGYQPFANWGRYQNGVIGAPIFDGSETSISGNGVYRKHETVYLPPGNASVITIDPQEGGGCVTDGPFQNMTVTLGPVGLLGINDTTPNPRLDGLGYNPRCLRRDLSIETAQGASDANITSLITENNDILSFQNDMQGLFTFGIPRYGVHTAGHYMVSGDPGGDFFTSPGDPWFWFHHAQIDRVYWIWQNLDLETRLKTIAGTITFMNQPPSRNATVEDILQLGVNDGFEGIKIKDALSTMKGPFCYIYE